MSPNGPGPRCATVLRVKLIRDNYDQAPTVNPCHLRMVYQGENPSASGSYNLLPWRIGMATETNGC